MDRVFLVAVFGFGEFLKHAKLGGWMRSRAKSTLWGQFDHPCLTSAIMLIVFTGSHCLAVHCPHESYPLPIPIIAFVCTVVSPAVMTFLLKLIIFNIMQIVYGLDKIASGKMSSHLMLQLTSLFMITP